MGVRYMVSVFGKMKVLLVCVSWVCIWGGAGPG
jgi:hypothetical protein